MWEAWDVHHVHWSSLSGPRLICVRCAWISVRDVTWISGQSHALGQVDACIWTSDQISDFHEQHFPKCHTSSLSKVISLTGYPRPLNLRLYKHAILALRQAVTRTEVYQISILSEWHLHKWHMLALSQVISCTEISSYVCGKCSQGKKEQEFLIWLLFTPALFYLVSVSHTHTTEIYSKLSLHVALSFL